MKIFNLIQMANYVYTFYLFFFYILFAQIALVDMSIYTIQWAYGDAHFGL